MEVTVDFIRRYAKEVITDEIRNLESGKLYAFELRSHGRLNR